MNKLTEPGIEIVEWCTLCRRTQAEGYLGIEESPGHFLELPICSPCAKVAQDNPESLGMAGTQWLDTKPADVLD